MVAKTENRTRTEAAPMAANVMLHFFAKSSAAMALPV